MVWFLMQALENINREKLGRGSAAAETDEDEVPPIIRRGIAVYEAARVLTAYITPNYDEISQVQPSLSKDSEAVATICWARND